MRILLITTPTEQGARRREAFVAQLGDRARAVRVHHGAVLPASQSDHRAKAAHVHRVHRDALRAVPPHEAGDWHLVCEDDCRFVGGQLPAREIEGLVRAVLADDDGSPFVINLGGMALLPLLPSRRHPRLCHATFSTLAHAYVGRPADLLACAPWRYPFAAEVWLAVPLRRRFARHPPLAYQAQSPSQYSAFARGWLRQPRLDTAAHFRALVDAFNAVVGTALLPILLVALAASCVLRARHLQAYTRGPKRPRLT